MEKKAVLNQIFCIWLRTGVRIQFLDLLSQLPRAEDAEEKLRQAIRKQNKELILKQQPYQSSELVVYAAGLGSMCNNSLTFRQGHVYILSAGN